jgi:hypothetical protein
MNPLARLLVTVGVAIALVGLIVQLVPALRLGRLPGDFSFGGANWRVYLPLGTSIVLSIALTLLFSVIGLFARR